MSYPALTYVDSTILTALIESGPIGDAVRRWFRHTHATWVSSEIALSRTLQQLDTPERFSLPAVLEALHMGIAIRPLPWERLSGLVACSELSLPDALELAAAHGWRCPELISNNPALRQAAEASGLISHSIGLWATATVGDWPRRSPIPP